MNKKTKRTFALLISLVLLVGLLTACGGNDGSTNKPTDDSSSAPPAENGGKETKGEEAVVTVWIAGAEDEDPTSDFSRVSAWAEKFNEENKGRIHVEVSGNHSPADILTVISAESTPDIFYNWWNNTPSWADSGAILDLTDYIAKTPEYDIDDFLPYTLTMAAHPDGRQFAIPWTVSTSALFYNKDMLAEAGYTEPPKSLDEILEIHKKVTKIENGVVKQAGIIPDIPWLENVGWPVATGAYWADEDGNVTFDTPEMRKAYQIQADMYETMGGYDAGQQFVSTLGKIGEATDPVLMGKVAMLYLPDGNINNYIEFGKDVNWGVIPLPGDTGQQMLTIGTFAINAKSKHPDLAWEALSSLTGKESLVKFIIGGKNNQGRTMARKSSLEALINDDSYSQEIRTIAQGMLDAQMRGFAVSSYINEYLNIINEEMSEAVAGRTTVEDAAAKVQSRVSEVAGRD